MKLAMRGSFGWVSILWLTLLSGGCALSPVPDTRTPSDFARSIEPKCSGVSDARLAMLLDPSTIEAVDAAYAYVLGGPNGRSARLRGARLHLQPSSGASRETLTRELECHEARVVLGRAPPIADDPYAMLDRWLDIEVDSEGDSFVALVTVDDLATAQQILARAQRYAEARRPK